MSNGNRIVFAFLFLTWCSCSNGESESLISVDDSIDFEIEKLIESVDSQGVFYTQCVISGDQVSQREFGENIVFQYNFNSNDKNNSTHSGYSFEIQFEINPIIDIDQYEFTDLYELNTSFKYFTSSDNFMDKEIFDNVGVIKLTKIDSNQWFGDISVTNNSSGNSETFSTIFKLYSPEFIINKTDTINRRDRFYRKQGYWEEEWGSFIERKGFYQDNYFSGTECAFKIVNEKKDTSIIWIYENNEVIEKVAH